MVRAQTKEVSGGGAIEMPPTKPSDHMDPTLD